MEHAGAGHTTLRPAQLTTQHSTIAPIATNLAMRHGTEIAQHLKHTAIDFNRKTRKLTYIFTHLVEILNPGKPCQQQMRIVKAQRSPLHHHASNQPTPVGDSPYILIGSAGTELKAKNIYKKGHKSLKTQFLTCIY